MDPYHTDKPGLHATNMTSADLTDIKPSTPNNDYYESYGDHPSMAIEEEGREKPLFGKRPWRWTGTIHLAIWLALTAYFIIAMVKSGGRSGTAYVVIIYLFITFKLFFKHASTRLVSRPLSCIWENTVTRVVDFIPERFRIYIGIVIVIAIMLITMLASPVTAVSGTLLNRFVSFLGVCVFLLILYATSHVSVYFKVSVLFNDLSYTFLTSKT